MGARLQRPTGNPAGTTLLARLRREEGFGLIELLIAMLVMALGIMAIVAGFSSGLVALNRASRTGTAGTLADKQMEAYRALGFSSINLAALSADPTYTADAAYDSANAVTGTCSSSPATCASVQTGLTAPDGKKYRLDTYIVWSCPIGTLSYTATPPQCFTAGTLVALAVKKITVVVRDDPTTTKTYVRETSTFDAAT